jgi:thiamine-phosphate pyrophosphorylase
MRRRHPLPRIWLMTDERIVDLEAVITRLPRGSGIVFRHHSLYLNERRALFDRVRTLARQRHHVLLLADKPTVARAWRADGAHHRSLLVSHGLRTVAVHNVAERIVATRVRADLIFVSPVFKTRSHPGKPALGTVRLGIIASTDRRRTIALGGMNPKLTKSLATLKLYGWAAIDAFSPP